MENVLMGATMTPFDPSSEGGVVSPDVVSSEKIQEAAASEVSTDSGSDSTFGGVSPIVLLGAGVLAYFLFFKKGKKLF